MGKKQISFFLALTLSSIYVRTDIYFLADFKIMNYPKIAVISQFQVKFHCPCTAQYSKITLHTSLLLHPT